MTLDEQINKEYIQAMKERNTLKSSTLNYLRAMIKQVKVDSRIDVMQDGDVIAIIKKQIKQRVDSIDQFEKGGRADLADKEKAELAVMTVYLPAEMSVDDIKALIVESIKESGASSMKDMGVVMKLARDKAAGCADGKLMSELVKEKLATL